MSVLGLHVAAGVLYYGAATEPAGDDELCTPVPNAPDRLEAASSLDGSSQLADFANRFRQDLRTLRPDRVGMVATRQYGAWNYRMAFDRISRISAVMMSCDEMGCPYTELKTEDIGRVVQLPAASLQTLAPATAGFASRPAKWVAGRATAFAAAITLLQL